MECNLGIWQASPFLIIGWQKNKVDGNLQDGTAAIQYELFSEHHLSQGEEQGYRRAGEGCSTE